MLSEMTTTEISQIRTGIQGKYARVANEGAGCCFKYPTGTAGMVQAGYPPDLVQALPEAVRSDFCGVGYPFSLGPLYPGDAVLDIGCGAGVDSFVAAHLVGFGGRVAGIDVTLPMIKQARNHLAQLRWPQVIFMTGEAEALPLHDAGFDAVISNGVFNLTLNKARALEEAYRVLKPGGRLMVADMVLIAELPPDRQDQIANWYQ
jgi:arsenite methyltransferase